MKSRSSPARWPAFVAGGLEAGKQGRSTSQARSFDIFAGHGRTVENIFDAVILNLIQDP
jgi:hypothetical protein